MILFARSRDVSIKEVLQCLFGPFPLLFATVDKNLVKIQKSKLSQLNIKMEVAVSHINRISIIITDSQEYTNKTLSDLLKSIL